MHGQQNVKKESERERETVVLLHVMPSLTSVNNHHIQEWMNQDDEKLLTDNTADPVMLMMTI